MPFVIPLSIKLAITAGAFVGGSVAVIQNKEKILEFGESLFQQGADLCREKLEQHKESVMYATDIDTLFDGDEKKFNDEESDMEYNGTTDSTDYDFTTPEATDSEYESGTELNYRHGWRHDLDVDTVD